MKKNNSAKLGQNFLINKGIAEKIVTELFPITETIIEIGPGKGVLTDMIVNESEIQKKPIDLIVVEIDKELALNLENRSDSFHVLNKSILNLVPIDFDNKTVQLIGNVPYYISKDIINWIITNHKYIKSGVLMFQKEFVEKILKTNDPKTKNAQNLIFNYLFDSKKVISVSRGSFFPIPKVNSTVFKFVKRKESMSDLEGFYGFLKNCFTNRRKTLFNNLSQQYGINILKILEDNNLTKKTRAEELDLAGFLNIYKTIIALL